MPVAFYFRQLQPREQQYVVTELEALALLDYVQHFSFYLCGRHFKVYSDHKALVSLSSPKLNNRLWRWRLILMDYDFEIIYVHGKDNVLPDSLSRQGWNSEDLR